VNDKLYRWVLKPVAKGYKFVVPDPVRVSVRNFFLNLGTPIRAVNALLQGKFGDMGMELARFGINSTIGMAGLFDPAKEFHPTRKDEDTGQTLGVYGLGPGFYLVLPILGPSDAGTPSVWWAIPTWTPSRTCSASNGPLGRNSSGLKPT